MAHLFDLTSAQQVFAVFYAIFFGTMLQTVGSRRSLPNNKENLKRLKDRRNPYIDKYELRVSNPSLNLFDTPNAWAIGFYKDNKPLWRTIFSILCLNILPGFIFAIIFFGLHELPDKNLQIGHVVLIVLISLVPQYIYRLLYAVLTLFHEEFYLNNEEHKDYNDYDLAAHALLWEDRLQFSAHKSAINHSAFPFLFFSILIILYDLYLVPGQINTFILLLVKAILVFGAIVFIACRACK